MKFLVWIVGLGILAGATSGCGVFQRGKSASIDTSHLAESLNLRVVPAGEADPELPDPLFDLNSERKDDTFLATGDALNFQDNIFLQSPKRPKALFWVWSGAWLGQTIQSAFVEHRLADARGQFTGPADRKTAFYQQAAHRWYLPFSTFFDTEGRESDPAFQHELTFDLQLSDGAWHRVKVRLRVVGSVPRLRITEPKEAQNLENFGLHTQSGIILKSQQITNDSQKSLRVWMRAWHSGGLQLTSKIGQVTYDLIPSTISGPGVEPNWFEVVGNVRPLPKTVQWQEFVTPMKVVFDISGSLPAQRLLPNADGWSSMDLAPEQTVTVKWVAISLPEAKVLSLPEGPRYKVLWREPGVLCSTRDLVMPWIVGKEVLDGNWAGGIQAQDVWESEPVEQVEQTMLQISKEAAPLPTFTAQCLPW